MTFLDVLRKLGILRFGAEGGVYRNAGERPASLLMDDVYDSGKDLVTGGDEKRARPEGGDVPR